MENRGWPPRDLQAHIQQHRKLIAADKLRYAELRKKLAGRSEFWELAADLLKARARYHRAEILRAKHDIKRFALGENPKKPSRYGEMVCEWATTYLAEIPEDGFEDAGVLELAKSNIQNVTNDLERITYGG